MPKKHKDVIETVIAELVAKGLVKDSGQRRAGQIVWVAANPKMTLAEYLSLPTLLEAAEFLKAGGEVGE